MIVEQGVGKGRTRLLCKRLKAKGGRVFSSLEPGVATHLLVGNRGRRSRLPDLLWVKEVGSDVRVVRADWLTSCLIAGEYVSEAATTSPSRPRPPPHPRPRPSPVLRRGRRREV